MGSRWDASGSLTIQNVGKLLAFGAMQSHAPEAILKDIEARNFGPTHTLWDLMDVMVESTDRLKSRDSAQLSAVFRANSSHTTVNVVTRSTPRHVQTRARSPPPSYGPRSYSRTGSPQYLQRPRTPECFNCGKPGHRKAECTSTNTRYQQHARHNYTGRSHDHTRSYCTYHRRPGHDTADCRAHHGTNQANRSSPTPPSRRQPQAATTNQRRPSPTRSPATRPTAHVRFATTDSRDTDGHRDSRVINGATAVKDNADTTYEHTGQPFDSQSGEGIAAWVNGMT
nr:uncharacterized protein LOC123746146 [Procambarus clarkii]